MRLVARRRSDGRSWGSTGLLVATVACALALALTGWSRLTGTTGTRESVDRWPELLGPTPSSFTLMQMNLCLSGFAGCYDVAAYPAVVHEAVARIREAQPDALTLSETCRRDAATIARRAGYHLRFTRVIYGGEPLPCVDPGGRGLFGDAVITRSRVVASQDRGFAAQEGPEERRWLCVTTRTEQDVCTAHLSTRHTGSTASTNDAQCAELAELLGRRAAVRAVAFGGDLNRRGSCAPDGFWAITDASAAQAPGFQHVYGSRALRSPSAMVLPAQYSDHDVLLVRVTRASAQAGPGRGTRSRQVRRET